jgi:hypothetical protein
VTFCLTVHPDDRGPVFRRCWLTRGHDTDHRSTLPSNLDLGDTWANERDVA